MTRILVEAGKPDTGKGTGLDGGGWSVRSAEGLILSPFGAFFLLSY